MRKRKECDFEGWNWIEGFMSMMKGICCLAVQGKSPWNRERQAGIAPSHLLGISQQNKVEMGLSRVEEKVHFLLVVKLVLHSPFNRNITFRLFNLWPCPLQSLKINKSWRVKSKAYVGSLYLMSNQCVH